MSGPTAPESDVYELGRVIWDTSRADEGTISVTGAQNVARAVLESDWLAGYADRVKSEFLPERLNRLAEIGRAYQSGIDAVRAQLREVLVEEFYIPSQYENDSLVYADRIRAVIEARPDAPDDRAAFCDNLAPMLTDAMLDIGIEDADLSDGRALADTVYCLGYRRLASAEGGN